MTDDVFDPMLSAGVVPGARPIVPPSRSASSASVVRIRSLTKRYGSLTAVDNIDLDVPAGSIFGLIGPNGAGKSTTLAIVASMLKPTSGSVEVVGLDPVIDAREVRKSIGFMPDSLGVYGDLSVEDYLKFFAAAYKIPPKKWEGLVAGLLELVDLDVKRESNVDSLSRGMKQRISLARSLIHDPALLLLDEPASGLDPRARIELRDLLQTLKKMGKTIVISSHILAELEAVCTDIAIVEAGRVLAAGPPEHIRATLGGGRRVRAVFADGSSEEIPVSDDFGQAQLLRRLVNDDPRELLSLSPVGGDLEDLFLRVTEGVVQ